MVKWFTVPCTHTKLAQSGYSADTHALTLGTKSDNNHPSDISTSHRTSSILRDLDIDVF
ncbi:hypothetical protein PILCRDRAFT_8580 [Piloderma croceum F 1598]|uniref:Uncharacterized protein n=1 Tax=Piloderma croceum (strain F 1598) TaxID=765440 RepID=A0A0C3BVW3_PILCF|nr:hypothetical protein PILCRDRAFT_8580 [Piloderma croceum F 1598]